MIGQQQVVEVVQEPDGRLGLSGSGRGASGRSNSSAPFSSRNVARRGRSRSTTSARRVSRTRSARRVRSPGRTRPGSAGPSRRSCGRCAAARLPTTRAARGRSGRRRPTPRGAESERPAGGCVPRRRGSPGCGPATAGPAAGRARPGCGAARRAVPGPRATTWPVSSLAHRPAVGVVGEQVAVQHRLHERAKRERVGRADEVDRRAHQRDPHAPGARSSAATSSGRHSASRLHSPTYQVCGVCACRPTRCSMAAAGEVGAAQEQLPIEGGAVEGAAGQVCMAVLLEFSRGCARRDARRAQPVRHGSAQLAEEAADVVDQQAGRVVRGEVAAGVVDVPGHDRAGSARSARRWWWCTGGGS